MSKKKTPRPLYDAFMSLPLSTLRQVRKETVVEFFSRIFDTQASVEPIIYCDRLGAWVLRWTVIVPYEGSVHGFVLTDGDEYETNWNSANEWDRLNMVETSLHDVWSAPDLTALATKMARKIASSGRRINYEHDEVTPGLLNHRDKVWMLRHAGSLMSEEEREAFGFLFALAHPDTAVGYVHRMWAAADHVRTNWPFSEDSEAATVEAVARFNGAKMSGSQAEASGIPGALMCFPRDTWAREADRLVKIAAERDLIPDPPPPPPEPTPPSSPPRKGLTNSLFAIAA